MKLIKKNWGLFFIIFLSLLPLINLLTPGLPISHDSPDHIARIANFYQSLIEGILIPRWAGNLNFGYGHPILMFLYPLPSYFASLFHLLGFSFVDSYKLVLATAFSLSGVFMYLWLKKFLGVFAGLIGAVFYLFAPYRFIDMYVRGAIGEHTAFMFIPLVLLALLLLNGLYIKEKLRNYYFGVVFISFSLAGLILSHNAISLLILPFIIFYTIYLFYVHKSKLKLILSGAGLLFGFLLSFFFWFPAFFEGKYTLRDIVTSGIYKERFVSLQDLIYSNWNFGGSGEFSTQIGIIQLIIVVASIFLFTKLFKKNDKIKILYLGTFVYLIISIFLMLGISNIIWENLSFLQKLQFPWRFLSIVVFSVSLIGGIFIAKIKTNKKMFVIGILIILTIIPTSFYWQAKEYKVFSDKKFQGIIKSTTDTGESSPIWSIRFMEETPNDILEVIDGKAQFNSINRTSTFHEYVIDAKEKSRIRENTLYFPGWKVYIDGKLINNVLFQDPKNRGIITFYVNEGLNDVVLKFEDTKLRRFANLASLVTIILLIIIPLISYLFSKSKKGGE